MTYQYSDFQFDGSLHAARAAIEHGTGVPLSERDSMYWGGTYFLVTDRVSDVRLQLHRNRDHLHECINTEFADAGLLCAISGPMYAVVTLVEKVLCAGGVLLTTRTREVEDVE